MTEADDLRRAIRACIAADDAAARSRIAADRARMGASYIDHLGAEGIRRHEQTLRLLLTEEARRLVYVDGDPRAEANLWNDIPVNPDGPSERAVTRFVDEAVAILYKNAGVATEAVRLAAAQEAALFIEGRSNSAAARAVYAVATAIARPEPMYTDDVQEALTAAAAAGITTHFTRDATPASDRSLAGAHNSWSLFFDTVPYLARIAMTAVIAEAERGELGLSDTVLSQAAQDRFARVRDHRGGISREMRRAARHVAAHRSIMEGLSGDEALFEQELFDAETAGKSGYDTATDVLEGRSTDTLDFDVQGDEGVDIGPWRLALPHFLPFGVNSVSDLMVIIDDIAGLLPEEGSTRGAIAHYAQSEAESKSLRRAKARILKNVKTLQPVLAPLVR